MHKIGILLLILSLAACQQSTSTDTVDSLVANPGRLKEVQRLCKENHAKMGDATCNAVAEATRRRFMGNGTPYTPQPAPPN